MLCTEASIVAARAATVRSVFYFSGREIRNGIVFLRIIGGFVKIVAPKSGVLKMQMMNTLPREGNHEETAEPEFTPMTAEQAQAWRRRNPMVSPWWVIGLQVIVGSAATLMAWLLAERPAVAWSVAYGALAVVLPAALFARGLTSRMSSLNPGAAVLGFFVWEMVKVALTVAMLVAAPRLVGALSWPAMMVGLVLTMKVYWVALAFRKRVRSPRA